MKALTLLCLLIATNMGHIAAQKPCLFYVYETKYIYSDFSEANEFEKYALEHGQRNLYIRINDTTFLDYYKLTLKTSNEKRRWFFNITQNEEPASCNLFRQDTLYNKYLSYNEIQIDRPKNGLKMSKDFTFLTKNDSIFIVLDNGNSYLRYSTKADTIHKIRGSLELDSQPKWFESLFLREETLMFFGDSITTLVFKEMYSNREEIIWYHKQKMIPLRMQVIYPGNILYHDIKLIAIYQF